MSCQAFVPGEVAKFAVLLFLLWGPRDPSNRIRGSPNTPPLPFPPLSVPAPMAAPLEHFVKEYLSACSEGGVGLSESAGIMTKCLGFGLKYGMGDDKYTFSVSHKAIRSPFDYYEFGVSFFRPAMDSVKSMIEGRENLAEAMDYVAKGHNVVFLANHQSEADPQVVSVLLEKAGLGKEASEITFLAGHKVSIVEEEDDVCLFLFG